MAITVFSENNGSLPGMVGPTYQSGLLFYDTDNDCPTFYNSDPNVALQIGQESWLRAKNVTGSTIQNGTPVYISGADATSGLPTIAATKADSTVTAFTAGLTTQSILNNAIGIVTTLGIVRDTDTSGFSNGAVLYASASSAGAMTATAPLFPYLKSRIGVVAKSHATTGQIHVLPVTTAQRMLTVRNTTDFPKTNTTLANVTGLSVTVLSGVSYACEALLDVDSSAIGGHKYAIGGTATVSALRGNVLAFNGLVTVLNSRLTALNSEIGAVGGTTQTVRMFFAFTASSNGTITIQFAQNVASGTSTVLANSTFQCQDVSS